MFNSDYEVVHLAGGQLQVLSHSSVLGGCFLILLGLVPTSFFVYRMIKVSSFFPGWGILIFGAPLLLIGVLIMRSGSLTLDKAADTATFHTPDFYWHTDTVVPLHTLQFATIRTMRASSYIAVVLDNGDSLTFADSSQQGGKGRAVHAINQYIGATDR